MARETVAVAAPVVFWGWVWRWGQMEAGQGIDLRVLGCDDVKLLRMMMKAM